MSRRISSPRFADVPRTHGFAEDVLPLTALMPVQFNDLWSSRGDSPERQLAAAVISVAVHDLRAHRYARRGSKQRLYVRAYEWLTDDDREWPFSFVSLCELLKLSPVAVRDEILELSPPASAQDAEAA